MIDDSLFLEKNVEMADVRHNVEKHDLKQDDTYKSIKEDTKAKTKEISIDKDSKFVQHLRAIINKASKKKGVKPDDVETKDDQPLESSTAAAIM